MKNEAHRLTCLDMAEALQDQQAWCDQPELQKLDKVMRNWSNRRVDAALQTVYRDWYAQHHFALTGRNHTRDCPKDFIRSFRIWRWRGVCR
jgi:hypothetical protein